MLASGAGDIYVLLLLAVAYLYTDQFGKLARFITKMKEMNPSYMPLIQLEAFLKLKSASGQSEALKSYIDSERTISRRSAHPPGTDPDRLGGRFRGLPEERAPPGFCQYTAARRKSLKKPEQKTSYVGRLGRRGIRIKKGIGARGAGLFWSRYLLAAAAVASLGAWFFMGPGSFRQAGASREESPRRLQQRRHGFSGRH